MKSNSKYYLLLINESLNCIEGQRYIGPLPKTASDIGVDNLLEAIAELAVCIPKDSEHEYTILCLDMHAAMENHISIPLDMNKLYEELD